MKLSGSILAIVLLSQCLSACGPVKMPDGAYANAPDLLADQKKLRDKVKSFRITGRVDHFGERRVQGKIYLFAQLPDKLRIDLVSPFGNTLSTLTVNGDEFALNDVREGRFLYGPAEPCNIARLVNIPLPPSDVIAILVGDTPTLAGVEEIRWSKDGFYVVEITGERGKQRLEIGPEDNLPLRKSVLSDPGGTIFNMSFDRWFQVDQIGFPHEIRAKMPRHNTDLLIRYDQDGVELNVDFPQGSWNQEAPPGITAEKVTCD